MTSTCDISANLECYAKNCNAFIKCLAKLNVIIGKIWGTPQHPGSFRILWTLRVPPSWLWDIKRMFSIIFSRIVFPNCRFFGPSYFCGNYEGTMSLSEEVIHSITDFGLITRAELFPLFLLFVVLNMHTTISRVYQRV